ncbi:MAG: hypothetical protein ACO2OY_10310 [Thermodesulfobacteriaceae bacterium]|jgi:sugar-specific transcriptional regulator TrmB
MATVYDNNNNILQNILETLKNIERQTRITVEQSLVRAQRETELQIKLQQAVLQLQKTFEERQKLEESVFKDNFIEKIFTKIADIFLRKFPNARDLQTEIIRVLRSSTELGRRYEAQTRNWLEQFFKLNRSQLNRVLDEFIEELDDVFAVTDRTRFKGKDFYQATITYLDSISRNVARITAIQSALYRYFLPFRGCGCVGFVAQQSGDQYTEGEQRKSTINILSKVNLGIGLTEQDIIRRLNVERIVEKYLMEELNIAGQSILFRLARFKFLTPILSFPLLEKNYLRTRQIAINVLIEELNKRGFNLTDAEFYPRFQSMVQMLLINPGLIVDTEGKIKRPELNRLIEVFTSESRREIRNIVNALRKGTDSDLVKDWIISMSYRFGSAIELKDTIDELERTLGEFEPIDFGMLDKLEKELLQYKFEQLGHRAKIVPYLQQLIGMVRTGTIPPNIALTVYDRILTMLRGGEYESVIDYVSDVLAQSHRISSIAKQQQKLLTRGSIGEIIKLVAPGGLLADAFGYKDYYQLLKDISTRAIAGNRFRYTVANISYNLGQGLKILTALWLAYIAATTFAPLASLIPVVGPIFGKAIYAFAGLGPLFALRKLTDKNILQVITSFFAPPIKIVGGIAKVVDKLTRGRISKNLAGRFTDIRQRFTETVNERYIEPLRLRLRNAIEKMVNFRNSFAETLLKTAVAIDNFFGGNVGTGLLRGVSSLVSATFGHFIRALTGKRKITRAGNETNLVGNENLESEQVEIATQQTDNSRVYTDLSNILNNINTNLSNVVNNITNLSNVVNNVNTNLSNILNNMNTNLSNILNNINTNLSNIPNNVNTDLRNILNNINTILSILYEDFVSRLNQIMLNGERMYHLFTDQQVDRNSYYMLLRSIRDTLENVYGSNSNDYIPKILHRIQECVCDRSKQNQLRNLGQTFYGFNLPMFLGSFLLSILGNTLGGLSNPVSGSLFTLGAGATAGLLATRKLGLLGKIIGGIRSIGSKLGIGKIVNFGLKGIKAGAKWLPKIIGRFSPLALLGMGISWGANKLADLVGEDSLAGKLLKTLGSVAKWASLGAVTGGAAGSVIPGLGTGVGSIAGGVLGGLYGLYKGVKEQFFKGENTTNIQTGVKEQFFKDENTTSIQTPQITSGDLNTQILNTIATNTSTMVSLLQNISNSLNNLNATLSSAFSVNQNVNNNLLSTWFGLVNPNFSMHPNYSYFNLR